MNFKPVIVDHNGDPSCNGVIVEGGRDCAPATLSACNDRSNETAERVGVIAEARRWIGTPYHDCQRVRGAGVDCAQLPAAVYQAAGVIPEIPQFYYSPQWHVHRTEERYLAMVMDHAREIDANPSPGDFVLFKVANCHAHGAIITAWPHIIHAVSGLGVVEGDASRDPFARKLLIDRQPRFFTLWGG